MFLPSYDTVQSQKFDRIEFKVPINVTDASLSIFMAPPAWIYDCNERRTIEKKRFREKKNQNTTISTIDF